MPTFLRISIFLLLVLFYIPVTSFAHGDLDERIAEVTKEIEMHPDSAYLYFKRGSLRYQHEEYALAAEDLKTSSAKGYEDVILDLTFSKTYFKLDSQLLALHFANKILTSDSLNVNAMKMVGKAYYAIDSFEQSALAFENVIDHTIRTFPFNYIDAATSWEKTDEVIGFSKAQKMLERGIEELGPIISLYERLIQLGLEHDRLDVAIQYQTAIIDIMQRKEHVLFKRGKMYQMMDKNDLAKADFKSALSSIELLPERAKNNSAMRQLIVDLNSELQ
jgi:tetratricopeptide (TPR) repeat protein